MPHPKHKSTPKGKHPKAVPATKLQIGVRSAELIRDNRKSAVIVPLAERPWVARVSGEEKIRMPINFKGKGYIDVKVTSVCFHPTLDSIMECPSGHTVEQFDGDADNWNTVLKKAAWGSNRPAPVAEMKARASKGWYVLDFEPVWFPREWWAQAKAAREPTTAERMSRPSGDTGHVSPV